MKVIKVLGHGGQLSKQVVSSSFRLSSRSLAKEMKDIPQAFIKSFLNKKIKDAFIYQSPIEGSEVEAINKVINHWQVILKYGETDYVLISFCSQGIQYGNSTDADTLSKGRKGNSMKWHINIDAAQEVLMKFLQKSFKKAYDLLKWNCRHFAYHMIKQLKPTWTTCDSMNL